VHKIKSLRRCRVCLFVGMPILPFQLRNYRTKFQEIWCCGYKTEDVTESIFSPLWCWNNPYFTWSL